MKTWYVSYWFRIGFEKHFSDIDNYKTSKPDFDPNKFKVWLADTFDHGHRADKIVILYVQDITPPSNL